MVDSIASILRRENQLAITKLDSLVRNSHLRQFQVAGVCGIHPTIFSKYVRGLEPMKPTDMVAIAKFFTVSPEDIIGWVDDLP